MKPMKKEDLKPQWFAAKPKTEASGSGHVIWCSKCGCPVVNSSAAILGHDERVHQQVKR